VFYIGTDQHVHGFDTLHNFFDSHSPGILNAFTQLNPCPNITVGAGSPLAIADGASGEVFFEDSNGNIFEISGGGNSWTCSGQSLQQQFGGPPAAIGAPISALFMNGLNSVSTFDLFYLDPEQHIHEYYGQGAGNWTVLTHDLTTQANLPFATP
jgi:hypothetical protein